MIRVLVDTSVVLKWFHEEGEDEVPESQALIAAQLRGEMRAHVIDLAPYEVGNVLLRALQWSPEHVANQLDDLGVLVGPPIAITSETWRLAATLGHDHQLSFYDACWAATARELGIALVSADQRLQRAALAESPTALAVRLGLPVP